MGDSESVSQDVSSDRLSHLLAEKEVIINGISDALMLLDAKTYRIIDINRAFLQVYHFTRDQVIGKPCHKITHNFEIPCSRAKPEHFCPLEGAVRTGEPFHAEHVHRDSEGRNLYLEMTAYPVADADGQVHRVIHLARDVTARKEAEILLKENAEKIKRFAYSVAHDLKNPSVAVYGITKLLMKSYAHSIDEKGRKHCEHILKGAKEIADLVENINRYIATKELPLEIEKVELLEILKDLREEFSTQLELQQVQWKDPDSNIMIEKGTTFCLSFPRAPGRETR
jgi:PAS domain S-box-containing protein